MKLSVQLKTTFCSKLILGIYLVQLGKRSGMLWRSKLGVLQPCFSKWIICAAPHRKQICATQGNRGIPINTAFFPALQIFLACRMNINTWDYDQAGITSRQTTWKHSWLMDLAGAVCISCPLMPALRWKCFDGIMWRINISRSGERYQRQTLGRLGLLGLEKKPVISDLLEEKSSQISPSYAH